MARRSGGASAGYGLLFVVGVLVWLANGAYEFGRQNIPLLVAILAFVAAFALLFFIVRVARRGRSSASLPTPSTAGVRPSGAKNVKQPIARWVSPGETLEVSGTTIRSGLFYFGGLLRLPDGRAIDQYAINSNLRVDSGQGDVSGASMPYWPSYADISPQARRAFLNWMQAGRNDPGCGIGHVFIFFYGLEHRLFAEGRAEEASVLTAEVRRLLAIYGSSNSFRGYAERLLACAALMTGTIQGSPRLAPDIGGQAEIPLSVRLYLGGKLSLSDRLSAADALLWLLCLPDFRLKTAAVRCFDEFQKLWSVRFNSAYNNGYKVAVPDEKLNIRYRAASGAFEVDVPGAHSHYPDVVAVRQSLEDLKSLVEMCSRELEAFSRFIGKNPDKKASLQAALLLPELLRKNAVELSASRLVRHIAQLMNGTRTATAQLRDLLEAGSFDIPESGSLPSGTAEQLGQTLDLIDVAMEPDRRYGSGVPQLDDTVVVFKADHGAPIDPTKSSYRAMKVRVEVAALAAASDGNASSDDLQSIVATIRADADLTQIERLRLIGYAVTIFKSPPKQERILRRLSDTREEERKAIAAAAIAVVGAQETADPKSVRFLEKLNRTLKLPRENVYADLHRAAPADEPVPLTVERRVPGIKIPKEISVKPIIPAPNIPAPNNGLRIDTRRLADVQRDTAAVAEILSGIFVEESQPIEPTATMSGTASIFGGLDSEHAKLLAYLQANGEVGKTEFEERAKALKLLPAGAIERINDWSFDQFDEPLLEEGDSIVLVPHLREKLSELKELTA